MLHKRRTDLTLELKRRILVCVLSWQEFHTFIMRNATLAFPILALTSASVPACLSMMLPRYVNDSTSSKVFSLNFTGSVLVIKSKQCINAEECKLKFVFVF